MRKAKFLLTLAAAAAVMSTAAMSFAQWDVTKATATGTVTMAQPVTIAAAGGATYSASARTALGDAAPTYTSNEITVTADLKGMPAETKANLTLTPTITNGSSENVTGDFMVVVKKGSDELSGNKDTNVADSNSYTVELTPTDAALADASKGYLKDGTTALTVEVEAELSAVPTT